MITQTCKYRRVWPVFLGASLALTLVTLIGALGGQLLGTLIPAAVLRGAAALAFIVMGLLVGREATAARGRTDDENTCTTGAPETECTTDRVQHWRAFGSTLGLLFVAELGDKTQLAVLGLASKYGTPWPVFAGGALALILITAIGVLGGQGLCRIIPQRLLLSISAAAFVVMGILVGVGIL